MKANQPTPEIGNDLTTTNNNKETINMANNQPTCPKCLGTGKYNVPLKDGSIGNCFTCKGTGFKKVNTNPMSEAQVNLIRNLFKELQQVLAKDEKNEIIKIMTAHIAGAEKQTVTWGSEKIDELLKLKAQHIKARNIR